MKIPTRPILSFFTILLTFCMLASCSAVEAPDEKASSSTDSMVVSKEGDMLDTSSQNTVEKVPVNGYCAVGTFDSAAKTAKILLENGEIKSVSYDGNDPEKGIINAYEVNGDKYTFRVKSSFPPFGMQYESWIFSTAQLQKRFFYGGDMFLTAKTSVFVRYSDTSWRVFRGRNLIKQNSVSKGYVYYTVEVEGLAKVIQCAMVVGACGDKGNLLPANSENTRFLDPEDKGWDTGDKNLA